MSAKKNPVNGKKLRREIERHETLLTHRKKYLIRTIVGFIACIIGIFGASYKGSFQLAAEATTAITVIAFVLVAAGLSLAFFSWNKFRIANEEVIESENEISLMKKEIETH